MAVALVDITCAAIRGAIGQLADIARGLLELFGLTVQQVGNPLGFVSCHVVVPFL